MVISSKYFRVTLILLLFHDHPNLMSVKQSSGFEYPLWSWVAVRISPKQQFSDIVLLHWNIFMFMSHNSHNWMKCSECHFSCILLLFFSQAVLTHTNHLKIPYTYHLVLLNQILNFYVEISIIHGLIQVLRDI